MAKLSSTCNKAQAIALLATGETQQNIGKQFGVSSQAVSQLAAKHRQTITQLALQIIDDSIAPIRQNHRDCLKLAHEVYQISLGKRTLEKTSKVMVNLSMLGLEPKDILSLADKKEHRALQIMGITPSHTPSVVINQLFQDNRVQGDSQELGIVRALLESKRDDDVQEAEIVEDSGG